LVLLQFKGRRKGYYHNRLGVEIKVGDHCLVEADRGRDLGLVLYIGPGRPDWWAVAQWQGVLELAGDDELDRRAANREEESAMWDVCRERIGRRGLDMNLVSVERQHDGAVEYPRLEVDVGVQLERGDPRLGVIGIGVRVVRRHEELVCQPYSSSRTFRNRAAWWAR